MASVDSITRFADEVLTLYLDASKVFDPVDYEILQN